MGKKLPIGVSDFKEVIEDSYYFVDKSLFIKEVVEDGAEVIVLPRPRRFGKTLNMSMVRYFYENSLDDNHNLFSKLKINEYKDIMDMQGKYPVIYITFKDQKYNSFENFKISFEQLVRDEFIRHDYILDGDVLKEYEKDEIMSILEGKAPHILYLDALSILSECLFRYHNQKVVILIDEYDVPVQSGHVGGYLDKVIEIMSIFFSAGFKDNIYLEKGVLTGIITERKEMPNNLKISTLISSSYSRWFGFLDEEVEDMLKAYNIENKMDEVREFYNGYRFGDKVIYNPWSILNFVKNIKNEFKPYWVNTSSNDLVKRLLAKGSVILKKELEDLIEGKTIEKEIFEDTVMEQIDRDSNTIWNFLLFTGYLKVVEKKLDRGRIYCKLAIPNMEVTHLYRHIILKWFSESKNTENFDLMLKSLVSGDIKLFSKIFKNFVINSVSYFDISGKESEKVYHSFVLGMLVALSDSYRVKSNRESGFGRYDIMIIPRDKTKLAVIIEFKKVNNIRKESLEEAVEKALTQIKDRNYKAELLDRGIKDIIELGIAFEGKKVLIKKD
ncbi:AAA family ATPase [Clostridium oceanicum]|uniref:AAA family ATPase n=1 Tax=Clostridium oceanicum TaxID=1543 RepID=A0ABP3UT44_9CLOT